MTWEFKLPKGWKILQRWGKWVQVITLDVPDGPDKPVDARRMVWAPPVHRQRHGAARVNSGLPLDHTMPGCGQETTERQVTAAELERQRTVDAQIAMGWGNTESSAIPPDWTTRRGPEFDKLARSKPTTTRAKFGTARRRR